MGSRAGYSWGVSPSYVLVVDDELNIRAAAEAALKDAGHVTAGAADGEEALRMVERRMPDLVVTDVIMPVLDGWSFVRRFRSVPGAAFVPVIFLTGLDTDEHRTYGFRLGADDFLPKPFKGRELAVRVSNALERRRAIVAALGGSPPGLPEMQGSLEQVGLASILNLLEMEHATGILEVAEPVERGACSLALRQGRIVRAEARAGSRLTGKEALFAALAWRRGVFAFRTGMVQGPDLMDVSTASLLLEGAARVDETRVATP